MAIMRAGVTHWHAGLIEVAHALICRAFAILMITHGPHHPITKDLEVNTITCAIRCWCWWCHYKSQHDVCVCVCFRPCGHRQKWSCVCLNRINMFMITWERLCWAINPWCSQENKCKSKPRHRPSDWLKLSSACEIKACSTNCHVSFSKHSLDGKRVYRRLYFVVYFQTKENSFSQHEASESCVDSHKHINHTHCSNTDPWDLKNMNIKTKILHFIQLYTETDFWQIHLNHWKHEHQLT